MRSIFAILALGLAAFVAAEKQIDYDCLQAIEGPAGPNDCVVDVEKRDFEARACKDAASNCAGLVNAGLCKNQAYYSVMRANCAHSCGWC